MCSLHAIHLLIVLLSDGFWGMTERCLCMHRSTSRNEKRIEAMRECIRMIATSAGGCCTPFPFEAAIWLLEEQEELYGGVFPVFGDVRPPCLATKLPVGNCCAVCS